MAERFEASEDYKEGFVQGAMLARRGDGSSVVEHTPEFKRGMFDGRRAYESAAELERLRVKWAARNATGPISVEYALAVKKALT